MKENKRFLYCIAKLLNYYWSTSLVVIGFWGREWPGYNVLVLLLWFARHCSTLFDCALKWRQLRCVVVENWARVWWCHSKRYEKSANNNDAKGQHYTDAHIHTHRYTDTQRQRNLRQYHCNTAAIHWQLCSRSLSLALFRETNTRCVYFSCWWLLLIGGRLLFVFVAVPSFFYFVLIKTKIKLSKSKWYYNLSRQ